MTLDLLLHNKIIEFLVGDYTRNLIKSLIDEKFREKNDEIFREVCKEELNKINQSILSAIKRLEATNKTHN